MKTASLYLASLLVLAACGGGRDGVDRFNGGMTMQFATGPVASACQRSDRDGANRLLCGCIQAAANRHLSRSDQRLAVRFFRDPHQAQVVKMSRTARDDAFWDRYKAFAAAARRACR